MIKLMRSILHRQDDRRNTTTIYKNPIKLLRLDVVPEVEAVMQTRFQSSNQMVGGTNRLLNFPVQN